MHDIPSIEPTPVVKNRRCKIFVYAISISLGYGPAVAAAVIWYKYDLFFAVAALLIGYIIFGIIRSKLRNSVIPTRQQEYQYSDKEIASWYVARRLCFDYDDDISI
jgi:hypothetical protein